MAATIAGQVIALGVLPAPASLADLVVVDVAAMRRRASELGRRGLEGFDRMGHFHRRLAGHHATLAAWEGPMGTRSSTAQKFISDEITQALLRAGLDYDHPIREVLDREAEIVGVRDAVVRVRDERN